MAFMYSSVAVYFSLFYQTGKIKNSVQIVLYTWNGLKANKLNTSFKFNVLQFGSRSQKGKKVIRVSCVRTPNFLELFTSFSQEKKWKKKTKEFMSQQAHINTCKWKFISKFLIEKRKKCKRKNGAAAIWLKQVVDFIVEKKSFSCKYF